MKAKFVRGMDRRLGVRIEPEVFDEQLLLEIFAQNHPAMEFRFYGWEQNGHGRTLREGLTSVFGEFMGPIPVAAPVVTASDKASDNQGKVVWPKDWPHWKEDRVSNEELEKIIISAGVHPTATRSMAIELRALRDSKDSRDAESPHESLLDDMTPLMGQDVKPGAPNEIGLLFSELVKTLTPNQMQRIAATLRPAQQILLGEVVKIATETLPPEKSVPAKPFAPSSLNFQECGECAKKPGSPTLCASCFHNRKEIDHLEKERKRAYDIIHDATVLIEGIGSYVGVPITGNRSEIATSIINKISELLADTKKIRDDFNKVKTEHESLVKDWTAVRAESNRIAGELVKLKQDLATPGQRIPGDQATLLGGPALSSVAVERSRQDRQWGGDSYDDRHSPTRWTRLIEKFLLRARRTGKQRSLAARTNYRANLVKIAALCVAAIEAYDRKFGIQSKR